MNTRSSGDQEAVVASTVQEAASELFQTAAMLLGQEHEAVSVVEEVIAGVEVNPCRDLSAAHREVRERVIAASLERMGKYPGGGLDAGIAARGVSASTCIESDDLSAAGITTEQLERLMAGPGRVRLREWLDRLSPALRAVFVLRALLGRSNEAATEALKESNSHGAAGWSAATVSQVYRQALCSLATSLVQSGEAQGHASAR